MEVNFSKYDPVILGILTKLKVKKQDWEDMKQECYLALLEKQKHLDRGIELGTEMSFAAVICRSKVTDIWRKNNQSRSEYKTKPNIRFESLSDPRIYRKAAKVGEPVPDTNQWVDIWELEEAMLSLPFEEFRVLYEIFVECKTQDQVARDLRMTPRMVGIRQQKGIENLKKYFEVDDES